MSVDIEQGEKEGCVQVKASIKQLIKPCFGLHLDLAVKIVAIIDFAIAIFCLICILLHLTERKDVHNDDAMQVRLIFGNIYMTKMILTGIMSFLLFRAACSNGLLICKIWMLIASILYVIWVPVFIYHWVLDVKDIPTSIVAVFCIFILYRAYTLVVVFAFINDLQLSGYRNVSKRQLKSQEIDEFINGNPQAVARTKDPAAAAVYKPYDKSLEICMDRVMIDEENPLEKGEFGLVHKGNLKLSDGSSTLVTVKKTTSDANISYFKTILSELKTLAYVSIGNHEHIMNIVGACTTDIKNRNLSVLLEFCSNGNMQNYLRTRRGFFVNLVKRGHISRDYAVKHYCNVHALMQTEVITTFDLLRWCFEISEGLKYLALKGVVHADMSAQNVYLSYEKTAKITNFGVPRQLYHLKTYASKSNDSEFIQLPPPSWRWLAVESLKDSTFSTKSDIWSFGVTIWEIFSLGDTPFPRMFWNSEFVEFLYSGLRMNKPSNATDHTYKLLLECWDNNPENRPSLNELSNFFEETLRSHNMLMGYVTSMANNESIDGRPLHCGKEINNILGVRSLAALNQDSSCDSSRSNSHSSGTRLIVQK